MKFDLLPNWKEVTWTWRRFLLLGLACLSFLDSLFIPISKDLDPGRAGERVLLLILGFRAASTSELPVVVLACGACLAAIVAALNHRLLPSSILLYLVGVLLLAIVMLWGRRRRGEKGGEGGGEEGTA